MSNNLADIADQSVKGSLTLFLGDAISTVVLALGSIFVARLLGPEGYGVYALVVAAPLVFVSLIGLGVDSAVVRFLAKFRSEGRAEASLSFLKTAIGFRLVTGIAAWLICFLSSDILATYLLNRPETSFYIKLSSLLILPQTFFSLLYNTSLGFDRYDIGTAAKICMSMVKSFSAPLLVFIGLGVAGAVIGYILGYVAAAVVSVLTLFLSSYRDLGKVLGNDGGHVGGFTVNLKMMIGYGLPLYISSLMLLLTDQYRLILLAHNVSNFEIGNFQAAGNFTTLLAVVAIPISAALFPAFSKLDPKSEEITKAFHYSVKYTGLLLAPISLFTIVMSRNLVEIVYGYKYSLAPLYLSLYTIPYLYTVFGSLVLESFFNGIGETKINFKARLVEVSSFIPLSIILTYRYSIVGLIVSILLASIIKVVYGLHILRRKLEVHIDILGPVRILIASGAAALALLALSLSLSIPNYVSLILGGVLFLMVYLTLLPIVKALQKTDVDVLVKLLKNYSILGPFTELAAKYVLKLMGKHNE